MTARFAGSRTLDERRRRYLATNEADRQSPVSIEKRSASEQEQSPTKEVCLRQFPVRKLISPKAWKIALASFAAGLLGFLILAGETAAGNFGPGGARLLAGGRLAELYEAGLLMLSGQLAFLIWWGRSQSLRDFEGQYRIWLWAACATMLAGWSLLGDWHWAFSETLGWVWSARFPQRELVFWMLPSAIVAGILWRKLSADMRDSKASFFLFALAGPCFVAACVFRLGIDRTRWPEETRLLVGASLKMITALAVFISFLIHARFVLHISPEPPIGRPSLWTRLFQSFGLFLQRIKKFPKPRLAFSLRFQRKPKSKAEKPARKSKKQAKEKPPAELAKAPATEPPGKSSAKTKAAKTTESKADPKQQAESSKPEAKAEAKPKSTPPEKPPAKAEPAPTKKEPPKTEASPKKPEPVSQPAATSAESDADQEESGRQLRVDDPLDPSMLKGLSKKERRRLRKQHKDAQRKKGASPDYS